MPIVAATPTGRTIGGPANTPRVGQSVQEQWMREAFPQLSRQQIGISDQFSNVPSWYLKSPSLNYVGTYTPGLSRAPAIPQEQAASPQDYLKQVIYNAVLPYLDPFTQTSTAQYLSRANPTAFAQYKNVGLNQKVLSPYETKSFIKGGRIGELANVLSKGTAPLLQTLDPTEQAKLSGVPPAYTSRVLTTPIGGAAGIKQDADVALNWLTEALKTAQTAATGSRAQQNLSRAHLSTLYKEAGSEPGRAGQFKTLFENITNPVTQQAPLSGVLGSMRTTQPAQMFQRKGVAYKNPFLT